MTPDLQKLRRFALAIGLVLITYSVAGVELAADETVHPLGFPFKISRPELLPIGLMLASAYGLLSFLYYGTMLTESPARKRSRYRSFVRAVVTEEGRVEFINRFHSTFPRVYKKHVKVSIKVPGYVGGSYLVEDVQIPWIVNFVARLEEINYLAPIWINVIALGLAGWRLVWG